KDTRGARECLEREFLQADFPRKFVRRRPCLARASLGSPIANPDKIAKWREATRCALHAILMSDLVVHSTPVPWSGWDASVQRLRYVSAYALVLGSLER